MDGSEIKRWRQRLGWTQKHAADQLGLSRGTLIDYERGERRSDGRPAPIPKAVELACDALERGVSSFGAGADYQHRAGDRPYIQWAAKELARSSSELEAQGRHLFAEDWRSYPYAMIAIPDWDDPVQAQRILDSARDDHGIACDWRFLPVAREPTKGWDLVVRVIVTPTIDDLMFFKMWLKPPQHAR